MTGLCKLHNENSKHWNVLFEYHIRPENVNLMITFLVNDYIFGYYLLYSDDDSMHCYDPWSCVVALIATSTTFMPKMYYIINACGREVLS